MKQATTVVMTLFLVALIPAMAATEVRTAKLTDRFYLNAGNDSVIVIYETPTEPFRPADFKPGDTVRYIFEDTTESKAVLKLYAAHDSLELRPVDTAIWVSMITNTDTIVTVYVFRAQKPTSHFLKLLREYSSFAGTTSDGLGIFSYADSNEVDLVRLRKDFHLDSIAGDGDEVSRIANLLHWVHTTVRHDGSIEIPPGWSVYGLLGRALKERRGVHCGILAIIMNEVYLAMGFRARQVVCRPYDTLDIDCHSVNIVWSRHLRKWLCVDPTTEGMFRDTKGELLNIAEIREAMVRGDSLIITDNLNWNGQPYSKDTYFRYMSKNLFRFACSSRSGPVSRDQSKPPRVIHLAPTGYVGAHVARGVTIDTSVAHITDNAVEFWENP